LAFIYPHPYSNNNSRTTRDIERVLRAGASMPGIQYDKSKIEEYKRKIEQMLGALSTPRSSLVRESGEDQRAPELVDVDSRENVTTSDFSQLYTPAFRRLLRGKFAPGELPSLIKDILARKDVDDITRGLPKDDAQTFIDTMDEVRYPSVRYQGSTQLDQY
jgi:hypothetical protein